MNIQESQQKHIQELAATQPYAQQLMFLIFVDRPVIENHSHDKKLKFARKHNKLPDIADPNGNRLYGFEATDKGLRAMQALSLYTGNFTDKYIKTPEGYTPLDDQLMTDLNLNKLKTGQDQIQKSNIFDVRSNFLYSYRKHYGTNDQAINAIRTLPEYLFLI